MTNRERLRQMTDEELAHWLCKQMWKDYHGDPVRFHMVRNFLKMEYKEDE